MDIRNSRKPREAAIDASADIWTIIATPKMVINAVRIKPAVAKVVKLPRKVNWGFSCKVNEGYLLPYRGFGQTSVTSSPSLSASIDRSGTNV